MASKRQVAEAKRLWGDVAGDTEMVRVPRRMLNEVIEEARYHTWLLNRPERIAEFRSPSGRPFENVAVGALEAYLSHAGLATEVEMPDENVPRSNYAK